MVVRFILSVALFLSCFEHVTAQENIKEEMLSATVTRAQKQWGQYMRVNVTYRGEQSLQNIDLAQWREVVEIKIVDEYRDTDELDRDIQVMKLRLYPRSVGVIQLPALKLGTAVSTPLELTSTDPVIGDSRIKLDWSISKRIAWEREAIIIQVRLVTDDHAARVKLDPIEQQQYLAHKLRLQTTQLPDGRYEHRSGWVIYSLNAGHQTLTPAPVRYQLAGSDRRRFHLSRQKLDIKPLPAYLPPILPVGSLDITTQIVQDQNSAKKWHITLQSQALIPYGSPGLDRQLADISGHDISSVEFHSTQSPDVGNIVNKAEYLVPLPRWVLPTGPGLGITVRYFDTEQGRLTTQNHTLPRHTSMPTWAWYTSYTLMILLAGAALYKTKAYLLEHFRRTHLKKQIRQAESAHEIRSTILSDGKYISLTHWSGNRRQKKIIAQQINHFCFSRNRAQDIESLKSELLPML